MGEHDLSALRDKKALLLSSSTACTAQKRHIQLLTVCFAPEIMGGP